MDEQAHDGDDVQTLARAFHDVGFVTLEALDLTPPPALVERVRAAVLRKYNAHLALAQAQDIDLALLKNAEVLAGFYVREGGRVDMQISALEFQPPRSTAIAGSGAPDATVGPSDISIDPAPFYEMARCWERVITAIFSAADDATSTSEPPAATVPAPSARYRLEYIGCVVSRPGDSDQNWHLDGVHRNLLEHERGASLLHSLAMSPLISRCCARSRSLERLRAARGPERRCRRHGDEARVARPRD